MRIGPLGLWEILILLATFGLPLWAVITVATNKGLTTLARVLLVGIAVLAPIIGPIAVLISTPILAKRREAY